MMSDVRIVFLKNVQKMLDDHNAEISKLLVVLKVIEDKCSQNFLDATMLLRWHRTCADMCKSTLKMYAAKSS